MTKKEFQEMVEISAALDHKYDAVLIELSAALGFTYTTAQVCAPDSFPDEGSLIEYIQKNILIPVDGVFLSVTEIDERELGIAIVLKYWEEEVNNPHYQGTITVGNFLKKEEVQIDTPSKGFLLYVINELKKTQGFITFKQVCEQVKAAAKSFENVIDTYVGGLKADKEVWRKYYKKKDDFIAPNYSKLYNSIKAAYDKEYSLTENDFNEGVQKWLEEMQVEMKSIKAFDKNATKFGLEAVAIEKEKLKTLSNKKFDDLGSAYPVYPELKKNFSDFLDKFKGPLVLGALAKYIETNGGGIQIPAYNYETYKDIKDDSAIYDALSTISIKDDVLLKALDETDPIYYNQDPVLSKNFEGFKSSIDESIKEWKNDIVTAISSITKSGLPEVGNIKEDLKLACIGYPKDICDQLISFINTSYGNGGDYNSNELLSNVKSTLMANTIVATDTDTLARTWWTKSDATLDANSSFTKKDLLPHPITIAAAFDENILTGISPQAFDRSVRAWRDDIRPAISLIAIDFPEGSTVVGKDLLEHLNPYFGDALLERLWTQMKSILPKEGETVKIEEVQKLWLDAIADANLDNIVLAAKSNESDGVGLMFLDFYDHYTDKNKIQAFCESAYILLPSKEEISLAVKNAIKKRPVVSRNTKKIKQLEGDISILELKDQYFILRNSVLNGYRNIVNETSNVLASVDKVALAYVKAHKIYDDSVVSCKKSAQTQADNVNAIRGTIFVGLGVVAGAFAAPLVATQGLVTVFGVNMAAGPVAGFAGGSIGKAIGSNFMATAKKLEDKTQTELEFYLELKATYPEAIKTLKGRIENIITGIDDKIQYLSENGLIGDENLKSPTFNLETEKGRLAEGTEKTNSFIGELSTAINTLKTEATRLTPNVDAVNIMEKNLYRIFITDNFSADSYGGVSTTDWDILCGADFFKSRLVGFKVLTEDDFIDEAFSNSDDDNDMRKLFKFANSAAENYL